MKRAILKGMVACFGIGLLAVGCRESGEKAKATPGAKPNTSKAAVAPVPPGLNPSASAASSAPPAASSAPAKAGKKLPKADTRGCPDGMVRVEGDFCPSVVQDCLKHHKEYERHKNKKNVSERCLKYKAPSTCVSKKRKHLAFCMDRFEYPNKIGELPRVLTSWTQAKKRCEKIGKRMCRPDEFNFACEGPDMLPYVNGPIRDEKACNIDKPYHRPDHKHRMLTYDKCYKDERCKKEMDRLDQRHRIGERLTCVSWAGVVDMNGNVNEWVEIPGEKYPDRSGLKGGWWGPVRNRCRPMVTFHKENDYGYEAGFRCCKDVADLGSRTRATRDVG